jgi:hypothetical protein
VAGRKKAVHEGFQERQLALYGVGEEVRDGVGWDKAGVVLEEEGRGNLRSPGRLVLLVWTRLRGVEGKGRTFLVQFHCRRLFSCFYLSFVLVLLEACIALPDYSLDL